MSQPEVAIKPGTIVKFIRRGRANRVYYVRVLSGYQSRGTTDSGIEYVTFTGYRVRPNELNVSFGEWHAYTVRTAELHVVREA